MIEGKNLFELLSDQIGEAFCLIDDEAIASIKIYIDIDKAEDTASIRTATKLQENNNGNRH